MATDILNQSSRHIIELENVSKTYQLGPVKYEAVKDVSFVIEKGQFAAIVGPSGSGKTTILNMIGSIESPTSGNIFLNSHSLGDVDEDRLSYFRRRYLGFIFQNFNLLPVLSAKENVAYPLTLQDDRLSIAEMNSRSEEALNAVGLIKFSNHRPMEMSGGQRQRVAIARAIVTSPDVILADEPTANLDQKTGNDILDLMKNLNIEKSTTFIFSTHDSKIMSLADHIIKVQDGILV